MRADATTADHPLFKHPGFLDYWCSRLCSMFAFQMLSVAVGWQIYDITHRALDLGIIGLVLFAVLPGNERLYVVLGVCSLSGAITYGSLIRLFWMRTLSSRLILAVSTLCALATSLAFLARTYFDFLGGWWLAAAWWFAFSGGLWFFDTHRDALRRSK